MEADLINGAGCLLRLAFIEEGILYEYPEEKAIAVQRNHPELAYRHRPCWSGCHSR